MTCSLHPEELKYLPDEIDTEKDHLLTERKGLGNFFLVQSDPFANVQTRWPSVRVKTWSRGPSTSVRWSGYGTACPATPTFPGSDISKSSFSKLARWAHGTDARSVSTVFDQDGCGRGLRLAPRPVGMRRGSLPKASSSCLVPMQDSHSS